MPNSNLTASLVAQLALAFLLAAAQLPAAFALDNAPASVVEDLVPFSSDEGLARLARSTAKWTFRCLPINSRRNPMQHSVDLRRRPLSSTPFVVEALTYPAIEAACAQRTFNTFRLTTIRPSRDSRRTT